jgi:uncharacterized protein (TIGR02996 family)
MPRYEFVEGTSSKFWEIEISGTEVTTRWGKIGTDGQSTTKDFGSDEKAEKEYGKLIESKTKKGYELVEGGGSKASKAPAKAKAAPKKKAAVEDDDGEDGGEEGGGGEEGWSRYEFVEDGSKKFWEIKVEGSSFLTRYGRIGSEGKVTVKEASSPSAARKEAEKLVASKVKKGYEHKGGQVGGGGAAKAQKSNSSLEAAIAKHPDDVKAYLVYADWLQGEGDVRGELITVQHGLVGSPGDKDLRKAEAKILQDNAEHFFGAPHPGSDKDKPKREKLESWRKRKGMPEELWTFGHMSFDWYCGFAKRLWFTPGYYDDEERSGDECVEILDGFLRHPSARFLQEVYVGDIWIGDDYEGPDMTKAAEVIARSPIGESLRVVEFIGGDHDISGVQLDATPILKACGSLERLVLHAGQMSIGKIDMPSLRSFAAHSGSLDEGCIKSIASAKWPNLEDLEIWFGSSNYGASGGIDDIKRILEGKGLEKVRRLGLMNAEFADDICRAIVKAPILKQLRELDLSMGILTEDGAKALLDDKDALAHLEHLNLERGFVPKELHKDLSKLCKKVEIGRQNEDREYRYVAVGE